MHPRQTISFLLLFVEFRNQTEQNNARSSRLGGGLWGVPCHKVERMAPQQRQQQGKGLRTANTGTSADCQTLRDAPQSRGATRERRLRVRWWPDSPPPAAARADGMRGTPFRPNTCQGACGFVATARRRAFLRFAAVACVRDARGALGAGDHGQPEAGASEARVPPLA